MVSYLDVCRRAARNAGTVLVEKMGKVTVRHKSPADLVTDADLAAEQIITTMLRREFPDHSILSEEGQPGEAALAAEYCWVVDPLDGTTNYAHGAPHFSVSVALVERGEPLVACVFDPLRDELFWAVRGQGAWLGDHAIRSSSVVSMSEALGAIGLPPQVQGDSPDLVALLRAVPRFQALRRTGSTALNLAYVAAGRFDAAWGFATRTWDVAAGVLLVREAGGMVCSPNGGDSDLCSGRFLVAATQTLGHEIASLLSDPPIEGAY
jgi:myo-inositol-1(or 4)-monophosphatase